MRVPERRYYVRVQEEVGVGGRWEWVPSQAAGQGSQGGQGSQQRAARQGSQGSQQGLGWGRVRGQVCTLCTPCLSLSLSLPLLSYELST
jgi:hypothetical protein